MLTRIRTLAERRASFAFETTLASRTFVPFLKRQIELGYVVHLIYVWLRSPELAMSRVAQRVQQGGHHVPDDVVARRYSRGLRNFFDLYVPLVSSWILCDNSERQVRRIAEGERGSTVVIHELATYDQIRGAAHETRCDDERD